MKNLTAKISCFARAYHYEHNTTHVFSDPVAKRLLGPEYDQIAQSMSQGIPFFMPDFQGGVEEGLRLVVEQQLAPSVLGRSAYCEAMLANERRLGCQQYVILASGYDTFAMRNDDQSLSVFELDLPDVLADKRMKAGRAGLSTRASYVACDPASPSWKDALTSRGFKMGEKSFASLLGISYYLDKDNFMDLVCALGSIMCEGSAICFDYPTTEVSERAQTNRTLAKGAGEPMKARYSYAELEDILESCGFLIYEHLDRHEMTKQYFTRYNNQCPAHRMEAPAGVGYVLAVRSR